MESRLRGAKQRLFRASRYAAVVATRYVALTAMVAAGQGVAVAADLPEVTKVADGTFVYAFPNGTVCHKRPDFISAIDGRGALEIKSIFSLSGSASQKVEALRNISPKAQEFEAVLFDLCYQRGTGQLNEQEYLRREGELADLRKAMLGDGTSRPAHSEPPAGRPPGTAPGGASTRSAQDTTAIQGGQVSHGDKSPNIGEMKDNATINIQ